MFSDADNLGEDSAAGDFSGALQSILDISGYGSALQSPISPVDALMEIAVQYAGDQAAAAQTDQVFDEGAFSEEDGALSINLTESDWTTTFQDGPQGKIAGVSDLVQGVVYNTLGVDASTLVGGVKADTAISNFLNANTPDDIDLALNSQATLDSTSAPASADGSEANAILVAQASAGTITAGDGNNLVFGGQTVTVGNGDNIIIGEAGGETITVGGGNNVVIGSGSGNTINIETQADATDEEGPGINIVYAGTGNDTVNFDTGTGNASFLVLPVTNFSVNGLLDLDQSAFKQAVKSYIAALAPTLYEPIFNSDASPIATPPDFFASNVTVILAPIENSDALSGFNDMYGLANYFGGMSQLATPLGTLEVNGSPISNDVASTDDFVSSFSDNGGDGVEPYYYGSSLNPFVPGWVDTLQQGGIYATYFWRRTPQALSLNDYLTSGDSGDAEPQASLLSEHLRFALENTQGLGDSAGLSVAQFEQDQIRLDATFGGISISDTANDVSGAFDEIASDGYIKSISLTDAEMPVLSLTATQAVNDGDALSFITGPYQIAISDTAADVSAAIDQIEEDPTITTISLLDGGTPVLDLSADQTLEDATALGMIAGPYAIDIVDDAADISQDFSALQTDPNVTALTLTDAGVPVLDLDVDQVLNDGALLGEITNPDYQIAVFDTAANIVSNTATLSAQANVVSLTVDDTVDNVLTNAAALQADNQVTAIRIVDSAAAVLGNEDALRGEPLVASVTVVDTASNLLADANALADDPQITALIAMDTAQDLLSSEAALASDGQITEQVVSDDAANVAANLDALESDSGVTLISLTDPGTPTLTLNVGETIGDVTAIGEVVNPGLQIAVVDTAADVSAQIDALDANAQVTSITLTDAGQPTLVTTATQAADDWTVFAEVKNSDFSVLIVDTAADIVANIDALAFEPFVGAITLTGSGTPTLTMTASQAVNGEALLAKIAGSAYTIAVADRSAQVAAAFDALNADADVSAITLTDVEAPVLDLTAAQALNDTATLAKITNQNLILTVTDTAADIAADAAALSEDAQVSSVTVSDTVANVLANEFLPIGFGTTLSVDVVDTAADVSGGIDALASDTQVGSITLTDAGTPTLTLDASQAANDGIVLGEISNAAYSIVVTDSAANVAADLDGLDSFAHLGSITLTDAGIPTLTLTSAQVAEDQAALDKITGDYDIAIVDTTWDVSADLDSLNADADISSITLTGFGPSTLVLSASQALDDTIALGEINEPYTVAVTDNAADVAANASALAADASISSISIIDDAAGVLDNAAALDAVPQISSIFVTDTAENIVDDATALNAIPAQLTLAVADTAADVAANIAALADLPDLAYIELTDMNPAAGGVATLSLSTSEVSDGYKALSEIDTPFALNVTDTASALSAFLGSSLSYAYFFPHLEGCTITITDGGTPELTLSAQEASASAYLGITNQAYTISVVDNINDIEEYDAYSQFSYQPHITSVNVVDTAYNVANYGWELGYNSLITSVSVVDSAANVAANLDALNDYGGLGAITLTDGGTPTLALTAAQAIDDTTALSEISNAGYAITIVDTADDVAANEAALDADPQVRSITVSDTAENVLSAASMLSADPLVTGFQVVDTAANVLADAADLEADSSVTSVEVLDSAVDVVASLDALNDAAEVRSIAFTDPGQPLLVLTAVQALSDARALSEIAPATVTVADSAAAILANETALLDDRAISGIQVVDDVANVVVNADALNQAAGAISVAVTDTAANILANGAALGSINDLAGVTVLDSVANVVGNLEALDDDAQVTAIALTDPADPLVLTASQAVDAPALYKISDPAYAIAVTDTAADVSAQFDNIVDRFGYVSVPSLTITLTDGGTPVLDLSAADVAYEASTLADITNADYGIDVTDTASDVINYSGGDGFASNPLVTSVNVVDTAADVESYFDALNADTSLTSITFTDPGTPTLTLTAAQALGDTTALGVIGIGTYQLAVQDSDANVLADIGSLETDPQIASIGVTDTASNILADAAALSAQPAIGSVNVLDATWDVAGAFDELASDPGITSITFSNSPDSPYNYYPSTLGITQSQAQSDTNALGEIANSKYMLVTSDTTLNLGKNNSVTALGTDNTYAFTAGDGADEIGAGYGTNTGTVSFGSQASPEDLWFTQVGENLQIDVMGTKDSLTVDNWFSQGGYSWYGPVNPAAVQSFTTSDGSTLDSQVGQLVSAMATFTAENPGFNPVTASSAPADPTLQGAIASAWHK